MRSASFLSVGLTLLIAATGLVAQQLPRFRSGANLVRVDAYVTADGVPVKDLQREDFEVLEDGVAQRVESFQLVQPRGPAPASALREPNTVAESREMARDPASRVFVIFMDLWHVQIEGSFHAKAPVSALLTRVIGEDDLVGVMVPDMDARTLTLARRPQTIEGIFRDHWFWGQRNRVNTIDPFEQELRVCYPADGVADELIRRRREHKTLTALRDLIDHLEDVREERKFVLLLTEGWRLGRASFGDPTGAPPPPGIGVDPGGRLRLEPRRGMSTVAGGSCDRERAMLAMVDMTQMFQDLIQRANRANVSFYPMDPRGLVVFDSPIGPQQPPPPSVDAAMLRQRYDALHTLAINSDGFAMLNTNALGKAVERLAQDTGAYYLLGYYSTNTRLDGKFRKLTVRVKRKGVDVRSRPGYLAPTAAEMTATMVAEKESSAPARVMSAIRGTALRRGPSTGLTYVESKDSSYRRTERLRFEVPVPAGVSVSARLLGPAGTPVNVPIATSSRVDAATAQELLVADLTLAPLAQGEYELELTLQRETGPEVVAYRFGLVP